MGKREYREILSRMRIVLSHLLKWKYQNEFRSNIWRATIVEQRKQLIDEFTESKNLENFGREKYEKAYLGGIDLASAETGFSTDLFPRNPEFNFESMLDENFSLNDCLKKCISMSRWVSCFLEYFD